MAQIVPAGIHDLSADRYHADDLRDVPTLSSSLARLILSQSPRHAWTHHPRLNPDWAPIERKTFDIGRAAHRAVLGKGGDYLAYPPELLAANGAASTKAAKEWADEVRAGGGVPLKVDEVEQVGIMADACRDRLGAMGIRLDPARSELTALAVVDGVWCRAMIDNAPVDPRLPLYDFKTCEDASPDACIRAVVAYGYDVQAAHYLAVWKAATGEARKMRFIFEEKSPPHEISVVELHAGDSDADWMLTASSKASEARRIWGECLAANEWPGYPARVAIVGAPAWHNQRWADREIGQPVVTKPSAEAIARATAWQGSEGMHQ